LTALIGDTHQPEVEEDKDSTRTKVYQQLVRTVMEYITLAMRKRRTVEQQAGVKSTRVGAEHLTGVSHRRQGIGTLAQAEGRKGKKATLAKSQESEGEKRNKNHWGALIREKKP